MSGKHSIFAFGAFGGILPMLAILASTYCVNPETPLPALALYLALMTWAIVGGGVALTNTSLEKREAIFAGIAAPAIIMSLVFGALGASLRPHTGQLSSSIHGRALVQCASAQANAMNTGPAVVVSS
jgi:hypothetical protein